MPKPTKERVIDVYRNMLMMSSSVHDAIYLTVLFFNGDDEVSNAKNDN